MPDDALGLAAAAYLARTPATRFERGSRLLVLLGESREGSGWCGGVLYHARVTPREGGGGYRLAVWVEVGVAVTEDDGSAD
jgi:hypothetical protein